MRALPSLVGVKRQPWLWLMLVAAIAAHVLMMGSLFWGYLNPLFSLSDREPQAIDFFSIYEAGNRALHNVSIYFGDPNLAPVTPEAVLYRYLPMFAYLFAVPANALPPWPGYWTWVAFYELLLVANAYTTWRIAESRKAGLIGAAMWFVFTPFYVEQYMGQFSFLMATLLFWVGIGTARGKEAIAGPLWAISLVVKSSSAVLLPVFLRLSWWRAVAGGVALVSLNGLYFLFRTDDLRFFYDANIRAIYTDSAVRSSNFEPNALGVVDFVRNSIMTLDSAASGVHAAVPISVIAVVAGLSLAATFLPLKADRLALYGIWLSTFFLVYLAWEHHYLMYLPVLVLLVALRPSARPWALVAFFILALPTPYWLLNNVWNTAPLPDSNESFFLVQEVWPAWGVVLYHAAKPTPVLALWGYLVFRQLKSELRFPVIRVVWGTVTVVLALTGLMIILIARDELITTTEPNDAALAIDSSVFREDETGDTTMVMLVGDSITRSLSAGLYGRQDDDAFVLRDISVDSCGVMPGDVSLDGTNLGDKCYAFRARWQLFVDHIDPDVVVIQVSSWDGVDRQIDGREVVAGSPEWEAAFRAALQDAVAVFSTQGASIVLLTSPYIGSVNFEPSIIDQLNDGARLVAEATGGSTVLVDLDRLLNQAGEYRHDLSGVTVRSNDSVHFTVEGSELVGGWLAPQLVEVADRTNGGNGPTSRLVNTDTSIEGAWKAGRSTLLSTDSGMLVSSSDIAYSAFVQTDASDLPVEQGETYVALAWVRSDAETIDGEIEIALREVGSRDRLSQQFYRMTNYWQPILVEHVVAGADVPALELLVLRLDTDTEPDTFIFRDVMLWLMTD